MFSPSSKLSVPVLGMSLAAISVVLYLSPVGGGDSKGKLISSGEAALPSSAPASTVVGASAAKAAAAKASVAAASAARSRSNAATSAAVSAAAARARLVADRASTVINRPQVAPVPTYSHYTYIPTKTASSSTGSRADSSPTTKSTSTAAPKAVVIGCWDYKWQQDAQKEYLSNLSDPWGLDGAVGPSNGDGLACTNLPVDPSRPASKPVDPYVAPAASIATKQEILAPKLDYFGVAENGLPGDSGLYDKVTASAGKAPSAVGWFSGWDTGYDSTKVRAAWARQSVPVITWMSKATQPGATEPDTNYSFKNILAGNFDDYLYQYAGAVVQTNLPVVIRFDHEMNGGWYPWGAAAYNNTPAEYIAVWRYVWTIFQKVGANADVSWLWSPARVDNLDPEGPGPGGQTQTTIAEDYPGDKYVDLVGATVYMRVVDPVVSYADSFGKTVAQLEAVSSRPLFFAEIGAVETDADGTDVAADKVTWIKSVLSGFLADPRVIGFVWFNNTATTTGEGGSITNDWRFDSSKTVLAAFRAEIADPRFAAGIAPDATH